MFRITYIFVSIWIYQVIDSNFGLKIQFDYYSDYSLIKNGSLTIISFPWPQM